MPYYNAVKRLSRPERELGFAITTTTTRKRSHAINRVAFALIHFPTAQKKTVHKKRGREGKSDMHADPGLWGESALLVSGERRDAFTGRWPRFGKGHSSSWPDKKKKKKPQ